MTRSGVRRRENSARGSGVVIWVGRGGFWLNWIVGNDDDILIY